MRKIILCMFLCSGLLHSNYLFAQSVGINNPVPDATALLDLFSTDKGLLIPRLSSAQRIGIVGPAHGLLVFDTTFDLFYYSDNGIWTPLLTGKNGWGINGNAGTDPFINFLGTTDNQPIVFRVQNTETMRLTNTGNLGIGTPSPLTKLHVVGDVFATGGFIANPGSAALTSYGFTTPGKGFFESGINGIGVAFNGTESARFNTNGIEVGTSGVANGIISFRSQGGMPGTLRLLRPHCWLAMI